MKNIIKQIAMYFFCIVLVGFLFSCNSLQSRVEEIRVKHPKCDINVADSENIIVVSDTINSRTIIAVKEYWYQKFYYTNSN